LKNGSLKLPFLLMIFSYCNITILVFILLRFGKQVGFQSS